MWYMYTMESYSATKRNEIMSFAATWMDLEMVILSEVRERQILNDVTYKWHLKKIIHEYTCGGFILIFGKTNTIL